MSDVRTETTLAKVVFLVGSTPAPTEVVINRGSLQGIKVGDRFLVFNYGPDIADPDTGKHLGRLELVRGRGEVIHVQDNLATIRSTEHRRWRTGRRVALPSRRLPGLYGLGEALLEEERLPDEELPFEGVAVGDLIKPV
jgi:hypothetical protein